MASVERFEDLDVWKRARELANLIYEVSQDGPFGRDFGLRDQIRRAAVSVMSNIAEGFECHTQARFIEYLGHAKASAGELRAQLYLASDRQYLTVENFQKALQLAQTCSKQLQSFINYLESKPNARRIREEGPSYDI